MVLAMLVWACAGLQGFAQKDTLISENAASSELLNKFALEIGGPCVIYSVNYKRLIKLNQGLYVYLGGGIHYGWMEHEWKVPIRIGFQHRILPKWRMGFEVGASLLYTKNPTVADKDDWFSITGMGIRGDPYVPQKAWDFFAGVNLGYYFARRLMVSFGAHYVNSYQYKGIEKRDFFVSPSLTVSYAF